jgi:hypothetical protein
VAKQKVPEKQPEKKDNKLIVYGVMILIVAVVVIFYWRIIIMVLGILLGIITAVMAIMYFTSKKAKANINYKIANLFHKKPKVETKPIEEIEDIDVLTKKLQLLEIKKKIRSLQEETSKTLKDASIDELTTELFSRKGKNITFGGKDG